MNSIPGKSSGDVNPVRARRASLPTPSKPEHPATTLKRTLSHKNFPHLLAHKTKSTPMNFSPPCAPKKQMHQCHSHCTLPHLPGSFSKRRTSLPCNFPRISIMDTVNSNRRNSYPCEALELRERELHRCRALHKANITVDDIAKEILKYKDQMNDKDLKKVKSEPIDVFQPSNVSAVTNSNKPSSKSFHSVCSSLVQVHHVDTKHLVHCDSIASSLTAIAE